MNNLDEYAPQNKKKILLEKLLPKKEITSMRSI